MHRPTVVVIFLLVVTSCRPDSEKSRAEGVNADRFRFHKEQEAHFVMEVLDTYYGLMELALVGESNIENASDKAKVKRIIQRQTSAMLRLKTFAERRGIEVPLSGPEKTRVNLDRLKSKKGNSFNEAWAREMKELQHKLKRDIEGYQRRSADTALMHVLDSTLVMVKLNNGTISEIRQKAN